MALAKDPQLKIGILDADVFGPSQPRLFGLKGRPEASEGEALLIRIVVVRWLLQKDAVLPSAEGSLK